MVDNGAQTLEGTEEKVENGPPPIEEKKAQVAPEAAAAPAAPSGEPKASEPAPASDQHTIRSVFVARTTADGLAVRGAYCARLAVVEAEVVSGAPAAENAVLRKAYLAHAVAEMAAAPRVAKRSAAGKPKKASAAKAKQRTAKPKKLGAASAKAKPRATTRRAAARPAGRGKRRAR